MTLRNGFHECSRFVSFVSCLKESKQAVLDFTLCGKTLVGLTYHNAEKRVTSKRNR